MSPRLLFNVVGLALWLAISLILQATGLSLLTSHLLAAAAALTVMLLVRLARTRRSTMSNPIRQRP